MPQDAVFGRDLAQKLSATYHNKIGQVGWTYDPEVQLDEIPENNPFCKVSPQNYEEIRETRGHWRETIQIVVSLVSHVGPKDDQEWIDQWLESWDMMVRNLRETKVLGRHKPLSVTREERYDPDVFLNHHRLFTQALVSFGNVEVK